MSTHDQLPTSIKNVSARVTWVTKRSETAMAVLATADHIDGEDEENEKGIRTLEVGVAIGDQESRYIGYLVAFVPLPADTDKVYWSLELQPRPPGDAPDDVKKDEERLGGWDRIRQIVRQIEPDELPLYHMNFSLESKMWDCRLLPRVVAPKTVDETVLALGPNWQIEQIGYRQPDATLGIREFSVVYIHQSAAYRVAVLAAGLIELPSTIALPYADNAIVSLVRLFFERKSEGTDA